MKGASRFLKVTGLSLVLAIIATPALAQGGSTGGTIGKQRKSISGGTEPRPAPAVPRTGAESRRGREAAASRISLSGQWPWTADCTMGHRYGVITLVQTSTSAFHGSFGNAGPGDVGTITDGSLQGRSVSFLRHEGSIVSSFRLRLTSMKPPTIQGMHQHRSLGACKVMLVKR